MQVEWIEKWIAAHTIKIATFDEPAFIIRPDDLRALLAGKVLCDAEPVSWMSPNDWIAYTTRQEGDRPLYAPASLAGNANIGKEGGK
jgi:hypothetical protein